MLGRESQRPYFMHPWISTCTMPYDVSFIIFSGRFYQGRHMQPAT